MRIRLSNILTKVNTHRDFLFSVILIMTTIILTMGGCSGEQSVPEISAEETIGHNTAESLLDNMSVGTADIPDLGAETVNDTSVKATTETQESSDTTVLTVIKEGMPEEIPATLYVGEGYSFYLTDDDWDNFEPDAWQAEKNNQVHFDVGHYEGFNKSQVEEILVEQGYVIENGELWMQDSDIMRRTICFETESDVWTVNFAYPWGEAEEGWLPVMRAMGDTFAVDAAYDVEVIN